MDKIDFFEKILTEVKNFPYKNYITIDIIKICVEKECLSIGITNEDDINQVNNEFVKFLIEKEFELILEDADYLPELLSNEELFDSKDKFFTFALSSVEDSRNLQHIKFDTFSQDQQYAISCKVAENLLLEHIFKEIPFNNFSDEQIKEFFLKKLKYYTAEIFKLCPLFEKNSKGEDIFSQEEREKIYKQAVENDHRCIYYINDLNISSDSRFNLFKIAIKKNPVDIPQIINPDDFTSSQLTDLYLTAIEKYPEAFRSIATHTLDEKDKILLRNYFKQKVDEEKAYRSSFIEKGNRDIDESFKFLDALDRNNPNKKKYDLSAFYNIDWEFLLFISSIIMLTKSAETENSSVSDAQIKKISKIFDSKTGCFYHNLRDEVISINNRTITLNIPTYNVSNPQDWIITSFNKKVNISNNVVTIDNSVNGGYFRIEAKNKKNEDRKNFVILYNLDKNELLKMFRNVLAHGMFHLKKLEREKYYKEDTRDCYFSIKINNKRNELDALFGGQAKFKIKTLFETVKELYSATNEDFIENLNFFSNFFKILKKEYENADNIFNLAISKKEFFKSFLALSKFYINFAYNYEYEKGQPDSANPFYDGLTFQQTAYNNFSFNEKQTSPDNTSTHNSIEILRTSLMHGWYDIASDGTITIKYYSNTEPRVLIGTKQFSADELIQLTNEKIDKVKSTETNTSSLSS